MNSLGALKRLLQTKILSLYTVRSCDRRRSLHDIARQTGISSWAVQSILADILGMFKVSAKWVPQNVDQNSEEEQA